MNRQDLLNECETDHAEEMVKKALDYFEPKFNDIQTLLEAVSIDYLDNIGEARDMAKDAGADIY